MREFSVRFTRWKDGELVVSGQTVVRADNFNGAVTNANFILQGMRRTDGYTDYEIASIESMGLCAKVSNDMNDIWNLGV